MRDDENQNDLQCKLVNAEENDARVYNFKNRFDKFEEAQAKVGEMGRFQIYMFFVTQIVVLTVSPSILCGIFDGIVPSGVDCIQNDNGSYINFNRSHAESDFYSLIMQFDLSCAHSYLSTLMKTTVMAGGVLGATVCGYYADHSGRRPLMLLTTFGVACSNGLLALCGHYHLISTSILLVTIGFFAGGNWVINLVMLLESTSSQLWRLALTSFNFWPLGMMLMSVVGYLTQHWRGFHAYLSILAFISFIPLCYIPESSRWLAQMGYFHQAQLVLERTARINGTSLGIDFTLGDDVLHKKDMEKYGYGTLLKHRKLCILVMAMFYEWFSGAIISFAIYFMLENMVGDRFVNFFLIALCKGITGTIPLLVSSCVGRRTVLISSVGTACVVCWVAVLVYFIEDRSSVLLLILTVIASAAIDPMWKVNHFYSAELFPTAVRTMARAVCNIGSRGGSLIGPQVVYLRSYHVGIPYIIFGVISTGQLLVSIFLLPETKGKQMVDLLPEQIDQQNDVSLVENHELKVRA